MVSDWAYETLHLENQFSELFSDQWITGQILFELNEEKLILIGFPLGIAISINKAIEELKTKKQQMDARKAQATIRRGTLEHVVIREHPDVRSVNWELPDNVCR